MSTGITKISYNGFDFENQPTPFLSQGETFIKNGENFGSVKTFTLNGQITGNNLDALRSFQKKIITGFSKDFGVFKVKDIGTSVTDILSKTGVKIDSINFPSNSYKKILNYNISLTHYPSDYFGNDYGIMDPQDQWSFEQSDEDILSATHSISAKGFETGSYNESLAFENAKNFVTNRTGISSLVYPYFIQGAKTISEETMYLNSVNESTDRVRGIYSITENYTRDLKHISGGVLRYNADINSEASNLQVTIKGRVQGDKQAPMSGVRARFLDFNVYDAANDFIFQTNSSSSISKEPITKSISEDLINKTIDFSYGFDDSEKSQTKTDISIKINSGYSVTNVSVDGSITSSATKNLRSGLIDAAFSGINFFDLANGEYNYFYKNNPSKGLNSKQIGQSFTRNSRDHSIRFSRQFDNKDKPGGNLEKLETNLTFSPSITKVKSFELPGKEGVYDVIDLGSTTRASLQISLNATADTGTSSDEVLQNLKDISNQTLTKFGKLTSLQLKSASHNTGDNSVSSLSSSYTFETSNKVFAGTNYDQVDTFEI